MTMTESRIHPETGKRLTRGVREQAVAFGSLTRTVAVPGWYPDDDSDSIHSGADLTALDEAYGELRAAYAARVKSVRKKLKLTQEEAGRIIGGGRRAFQKYESGATPPSEAAIGLIELLDRHPEEVEMLRGLRAQVSILSGRFEGAKRDLAGGRVRKRGLAA
ncbi:transcriptional regulator, XRE family protein [Novosphingobium nitrogenifigens DSM 19370]|uniref:Transcriptional regulator, XRE family protein n=2 Tax=Novosphingobium nitrogenifigens TaxID=378548 RepID=F1ZCX1_9SPHN|nr:type II TA system antitoxin MqsA family protein [Novosphingobium nitrogenifigens]EGD57542.1 transcriptional regulator, XRE family protein [Novosphingobium nitrogenifigens DSM 19370]